MDIPETLSAFVPSFKTLFLSVEEDIGGSVAGNGSSVWVVADGVCNKNVRMRRR